MGEELGALYIIEGAVRKGGSKIRVNVQAVDAKTGTHLWAETLDRNLSEVDVFAVQDEITDQVVATIADPYGILARSMAAPTAAKAPEELTPYEAVLRYFLYNRRVSAEDHLPTRIALERAVKLQPGNADAWAGLAMVILDEDRPCSTHGRMPWTVYCRRPNARLPPIRPIHSQISISPRFITSEETSEHFARPPSVSSGSTGATATP